MILKDTIKTVSFEEILIKCKHTLYSDAYSYNVFNNGLFLSALFFFVLPNTRFTPHRALKYLAFSGKISAVMRLS